MSKTLGNVIDPLDSIAEYGTDALRFTLATGTTPGQVSPALYDTHQSIYIESSTSPPLPTTDCQ